MPRGGVTDPTGRTVAANVRRIREARGWSTYELSRRLDKAGRSIAPSALAKLERGERRVDAGDLVALAATLHVNPSALLLAFTDAPDDVIEITGFGRVTARVAWDWGDGRRPLPTEEVEKETAMLEHMLWARPIHRRTSHLSP